MRDLLNPKWWDARIPTKKDLEAIGLKAPGANWWDSLSIGDLNMSTFKMREQFLVEFSFAIPCREALEFIASHSRNIVEVGAGTGFWSEQLRRLGVDIVATDAGGDYRHTVGGKAPVVAMGAVEAVQAYPERDVLMIWPCYNKSWAREVAEAMRPGQLLLYIGEHSGCTADESFRDYVDANFTELAEFDMVQWWGIHDQLWAYRKNETSLLEKPHG